MRLEPAGDVGRAIVCACALVAPASRAVAQEAALDPRIGVAVPVGAFADFVDAGPSVALGAGLRVHPRFSLRADVAVDDLDGSTIPAQVITGGAEGTQLPGIRIWRYTAGAEADVIVPGLTPLTVVADVGVGGASIGRPDADPSAPDPVVSGPPPATHLTAHGGVRIGWDFSRRLNAFAAAHAMAMFTGDPLVYVAQGTELLAGNGTLWAVPIVAGLRIRFY